MQRELDVIGKILDKGKPPILSILGGAKVSSKLKIINNLVEQVDKIIISGGMAFTFIKANGGEIGDSLYEPSLLNEARLILEKAKKLKTEIHLPLDVLAAKDKNNIGETEVFNIDKIEPGWMGMDISRKSIAAFEKVIMSSNTVFWNGPMGVFEKEKFKDGSIRMPLSALNVDIFGADIEDSPLVFETGDQDGLLKTTSRGVLSIPWLKNPTALAPVSMFTEHEEPFEGDPRHALERIMKSYESKGLKAIAATEMEFSNW